MSRSAHLHPRHVQGLHHLDNGIEQVVAQQAQGFDLTHVEVVGIEQRADPGAIPATLQRLAPAVGTQGDTVESRLCSGGGALGQCGVAHAHEAEVDFACCHGVGRA